MSRMPDGNTAAERQHDREEAKAEADFDRMRPAALDDLVGRIMCGEAYPKRGRGINLGDILLDSIDGDAERLIDAVTMALSDRRALDTSIEAIVRDYLTDSEWVERRIEDMIEEERDNA